VAIATTLRPTTSSRSISGQRRRVTQTIKRELRRRSAVEPVIGHTKAEHRMGRIYLARTHGDAANAVLAAAGYNFRRRLEWLALLLSIILVALSPAAQAAQTGLKAFVTGDNWSIAPKSQCSAFCELGGLTKATKCLIQST
jgi:IS5 family transposase